MTNSRNKGKVGEREAVVSLPWPPSLNAYYRTWRGRVLISEKGRAYQRDAMLAIAGTRLSRTTGRVAVEITAHPPDRRRRDLDNLQKVLLDSLVKGGLIEDDSMIDDLRIKRGETVKDGRVHVSIHQMAKESQ